MVRPPRYGKGTHLRTDLKIAFDEVSVNDDLRDKAGTLNLLPLNRFKSMFFQVAVSFLEMAAAAEAEVGGERRRVRCFQNPMSFGVDQSAFFLSVGTPEQKNDVLALCADGVDDGIGEFLPAFALMRAGVALPHGQLRI